MRRTTMATVMLLGAGAAGGAWAGEAAEKRRVEVRTVEADADGEVIVVRESDSPEARARRVVVMSHDGEGEHPRFFVGEGAEGFHFAVGPRIGLGVHLTEVTPELRAHFGAPEDEGVLVAKIVPDSPAQRAGLAVGDLLARVDGEPVTSAGQIARRLAERKAGDIVTVEVWRDGRLQTVSTALAELPAPEHLLGERLLPEHLATRVMKLRCAEGEDCAAATHFRHFDASSLCPQGERCRIEIRCEDAGCTCSRDGENVACPEGVGKR